MLVLSFVIVMNKPLPSRSMNNNSLLVVQHHAGGGLKPAPQGDEIFPSLASASSTSLVLKLCYKLPILDRSSA